MRRTKPEPWLRYWQGGTPARSGKDGFKSVLVYCVGPPSTLEAFRPRCHHNSRLKFADLPEMDWYDISARLRCTKCGSVGYVDTRLDWSEVIDFNRPSNP